MARPQLLTANSPISIHLIELPTSNPSHINTDLERRMDIAQRIVSLARFLREKSKLRIRQPLRRILIPVNSPTERRDIQQVEDIIKEELNIKAIEFMTDDTSGIISKSAKGNFKTLGKKFGKQTQTVANHIKDLTNEQIKELERNGSLNVGEFTLDLEDVEIISNDIEGWLVANDGPLTVALDTSLDDELVQEGIAREFVSRIQNLRKDSGFDVVDRIYISVTCDENTKTALLAKTDYVNSETLCERLDFSDNVGEQYKIEFLDSTICVKVERV
jgi:isoleucyl-tRNA synthetase